MLGGGSLRGTGVGSTTGEGEEESPVPSTKRARATGNKVYILCTKVIGKILSVDVELPFLTIRNSHTHTHNRMPPYTSWNVC